MNIVFLDAGTFPEGYQFHRPSIAHHWQQYAQTSAEQVVERLSDADIVITNKVKLSAELLAKLPKLKFIAVAATGFNNIDIDYCKAQGIAVNNVVNYSTDSVCEHILMFMLTLSRQQMRYAQDSQVGNWTKSPFFCRQLGAIKDITGTTLCIVGKGNLGAALAQKVQALGVKVIFAERKGAMQIRAGYVEFHSAIANADFVSLNCPLTIDNQQLFSTAEFAQMKPTSFFINTARGPLVDEHALVTAIESKQIAGCALDVVSLEPMAENNPIIRILSQDNVLITPHIAWSSESALRNLVAGINQNIERFVQDQTLDFLVS